MNSDYIPRLRAELLRAGATEQARWRGLRPARALRPLAAAAALALIVVAVVLALPDRRGGETPAEQPAGAVHLTYRVAPAGDATARQAAQVMRERLEAAGVPGAGVSVSSSESLTITAPERAREDVTALAKRGRLAIYDWERSVLGPRGAPDATDTDVTGGPDAARAAAITRAEAEARVARRPRGGHVVRALSVAPEGWFALGAGPAISNADIERAARAVDPVYRDPIVTLDFTARGQTAFTTLTRELARRGAARAGDGVGRLEALQHFVIVLDDQIVSAPFIDFRHAPDGIDGASGAQIQGDLTSQTARRIAALLSAGPLAADLVPESGGAVAEPARLTSAPRLGRIDPCGGERPER